MNKALACIMVGICLGVAFLWSGSAPAAADDLGKNVFMSKCALCHGPKVDGKGPAAATLTTPPGDFTSPKFWEGNVEKKISDSVVSGKGVMPAQNLKPEEIKAVTDYITKTFKN